MEQTELAAAAKLTFSKSIDRVHALGKASPPSQFATGQDAQALAQLIVSMSTLTHLRLDRRDVELESVRKALEDALQGCTALVHKVEALEKSNIELRQRLDQARKLRTRTQDMLEVLTQRVNALESANRPHRPSMGGRR